MPLNHAGHRDHLGERGGAHHVQAAAPEGLRDPVCGMAVSPDSPYFADHAGHTYHFCSAKCQGKFAAEPQRYLTPQPALQAATTENVEYTCPMHPEVRQIGPGTCPKCGMTLEPMLPTGEDAENPELVDFRHRFWWTLPLTVLVTAIAMSGGFFDPLLGASRPWVELALATPVVLWSGWPFFVRWAQSIRNRSPNMWTLIGTGTGAAYVYSVVATVAPDVFPDSFRMGE